MGIYESHFAKDDEDGHHGHAEQEADAVKVALAGESTIGSKGEHTSLYTLLQQFFYLQECISEAQQQPARQPS
jgi:hypothetical protein